MDQKDAELLLKISHADSLQELVDLGFQLLGNPIFIDDMSWPTVRMSPLTTRCGRKISLKIFTTNPRDPRWHPNRCTRNPLKPSGLFCLQTFPLSSATP